MAVNTDKTGIREPVKIQVLHKLEAIPESSKNSKFISVDTHIAKLIG